MQRRKFIQTTALGIGFAYLSASKLFGGVNGEKYPELKKHKISKTEQVDRVLRGEFAWELAGPLVGPAKREGEVVYSIKDPTVVRYEGKWHLFCTIRGKVRSNQIEYLSFTDWEQADRAERHVMKLREGYFCAPQVFYFQPHKQWYMLLQVMEEGRKQALQPAWSRTKEIDKPDSWSEPVLLYEKTPTNVLDAGKWIDFWVICDQQKAHLFFTTPEGKMWRAETSIGDFPLGWNKPQIALQADIFEAAHVYKLKGKEKYLAVIEEIARGARYFKAYLADSLDGKWQPLATTREKPFASPLNIRNTGKHWTDSVSHGEFLRAGYDERLEIDPENLRFLFQGVTKEAKRGANSYGEIPWRLGMLESTMNQE